jgi:glycogen operon protein
MLSKRSIEQLMDRLDQQLLVEQRQEMTVQNLVPPTTETANSGAVPNGLISYAAFAVESGTPHPLGASPGPEGVNFSLFSGNATGVELLLFATHNAPEPFQVIPFDPCVNKSFHFWHVFVRGLKAGTHYAYRVDGPYNPAAGHRFNKNKVLIDPYARGNTNSIWKRASACGPDENLPTSMRSVVIDTSGYDWEGDRPLNRPMQDTIIYEMHVRGFTKSPSSGVQHPGTFAGIVEKIPYLKDLGVTAVELLPVFDFDETAVLREVGGRALTNYWGYSTSGFFAPQSSYCVSPDTGSHLREFRDMVKAMHQAGIEVILDVVFNHTDEGNHLGPTFSFRGIDNRSHYFLVPWDLQYGLFGLRKHLQLQPSNRAEADHRMPALLGTGGAR